MNDEEKIMKELEPVINKLRNLYDEIDNMVKLGIITQEQADDMTGATIDKMELEEKTKMKEKKDV